MNPRQEAASARRSGSALSRSMRPDSAAEEGKLVPAVVVWARARDVCCVCLREVGCCGVRRPGGFALEVCVCSWLGLSLLFVCVLVYRVSVSFVFVRGLGVSLCAGIASRAATTIPEALAQASHFCAGGYASDLIKCKSPVCLCVWVYRVMLVI